MTPAGITINDRYHHDRRRRINSIALMIEGSLFSCRDGNNHSWDIGGQRGIRALAAAESRMKILVMPDDISRYTAVWLDDASRASLLARFPLPSTWEVRATHMTVSLTPISSSPALAQAGQRVTLNVVAMAADQKAIAVQVQTPLPCTNKIPHITLGIDRLAGGESKHSNELTDWRPIAPFSITGVVCEIDRATHQPI